ncbi:HlyD family secretion protein [Tepidibacter mesophilus]|uniref:HlyD family secretion protein n=1 Tax=Tepidibacter mesophilus TaxID=655607 RepID=UPI000C08868F|nr:efflux RND transporter periplasmic adaptor subunit [Tepidibacter mesophilus]
MRRKKNVFILVISGLLLLTGCSTNEYSKAEYKNDADKPAYIMAGRINSIVDSDISTKISGKVAEVFVKEGDTVKMGTPILKLETKELEAQLSQAEAGVALAQANYDKIKVGARSEQKTQAKAALDNAQKSKEIAKANYNRDKELYESGAMSKQQLEIAELQLQGAISQETSAQAQLDLLNSGETKENLKVGESQLKQAQAALESVKAQLDNGIIKAPYEGIITSKQIQLGELASPGMKLFTIQGEGAVKVEAKLPESLLGKIKKGDKVLVKVPDYSNKEYEGVVTLLSQSLDNSGKGLDVEVAVVEKDKNIKVGMFAEIGLKK